MPRVIALDLPGGPAFVDAVQRVWDRGDAVFVLDRRLPEPAQRALLDAVRPHRVVTAHGDRPPRTDPIAPTVEPGDALVVATSGSTGAPKLVVHTRAGLEAHARAVNARLSVDPAADRWLACLPLAHLGGLGVVLRSVLTDTAVDVIDGFDAEAVAEAPTRRGTTLVSLVPTALDRIRSDGYRWVVVGGAADPTRRAANVVRTYGLTETGGGVVYDGVPLDGVEVDVADDGEVRVRGPVLARGRRRPDGSVEPFTDQDGWLATGDRGRWVDGRLAVDGRADDLIVTGGENVWPTPVEEVLARHPEVAEVAVVGAPDEEWGRRVVAHVVPKDPSAPPTLESLRDHVKHHLPSWNAPRELQLRSDLPKTNLGKVRRKALTDQEPKDH